MSDHTQLKVVNDSGYPLQIAAHRAIDSHTAMHGWRVRFSEHHWTTRTDERQGFADLVVANASNTLFAVIECKRVRDVEWLMFHSDGRQNNEYHAQVWFSKSLKSEDASRSGWASIAMAPTCPVVHFCAIRGQSTNTGSTLIERIASEVALATQNVANQWLGIRFTENQDYKIFIPLILTTAKLRLASFDPSAISLVDGTLPDATFTEVPYVRFQKQLGIANEDTYFGLPNPSRPLESWWENTVFIVYAPALNDFLSSIAVKDVRILGSSGAA